MRKVLFLVGIFYVLFLIKSCVPERDALDLEKIQGRWVFDSSTFPSLRGKYAIGRTRDNCGFRFDGQTCYLDCSFFESRLKSNVCNGMSNGYETKFLLSKDSLNIWDEKKQNWHSYLIKKLTLDSLILLNADLGYEAKYIRPKVNKTQNSQFDAIIISKLFFGQYMDCNEEVFYLNLNGDFYYNSQVDVLNSGKVNPSEADSLFANFKYINFNRLESQYVGGGGGDAIFYCVSFVKDNKVVKRVINEENTGPDELLIGYVPLVDFLRKVKHDKRKIDENILELVNRENKWFSEKIFEPQKTDK